ncbi:hypothetical protein [Nocardia sp. NPDC046763]|uniref:hypothetical protein n=1 Tax=Nocardia sp. NPDC046763 TaxID=3155256 RepID=UPI0033C162FF
MSFRVVPDQLRFLSAEQITYQGVLSQILNATKTLAAPARAAGGDIVHQSICTMLHIQRDTIFDHTETAHTNWGQCSEAMNIASRSYETTDSAGAAAVQSVSVNV